jgi:hypothetical protein
MSGDSSGTTSKTEPKTDRRRFFSMTKNLEDKAAWLEID